MKRPILVLSKDKRMEMAIAVTTPATTLRHEILFLQSTRFNVFIIIYRLRELYRVGVKRTFSFSEWFVCEEGVLLMNGTEYRG